MRIKHRSLCDGAIDTASAGGVPVRAAPFDAIRIEWADLSV